MRTTILLFGLVCGVLIAVLQLIEYRFLVVEHSLQIYGALVAILFAAIGIWLGRKIAGARHASDPISAVRPAGAFVVNRERMAALGITPREHEILELIALGLSNREIAEKLFVSENTVKTHSRRLFDKLNAKRRTQAVQFAKNEGLIA
ncbi:MAG TPA: response regulator transcription factor [Gemmatimonadaceae bacterium]|nr:response regulator transcription factor [Gemmatimonadaceae bacterium]